MSELLFTWFIRELTVYNCPIESPMSIGQGKSDYEIEVWKHCDHHNKKTFHVSKSFRGEMNAFITNGEIESDELVEVFINAFGCVPLYNNTNRRYCGMQFNSIEEYFALRKPIPRVELLGIQLPKAYVANMGVIHRMCTDLNVDVSELTLEHFPDYLQPHLQRALELLVTELKYYRVENAAVYDYLEIIDIIFDDRKFVDGEELVDVTTPNMLRCGYSYESATIFNTDAKIAFHRSYDASLITNNIIKYSNSYGRIESQFPAPDSIDIAAMRLFLDIHGKN
jgi:hypothetical protein